MELLSLHVQPGYSNPNNSFEFYNLCLSLSRGIDYAIGNGEIPTTNTKELATLMKQISQRNNDEISQGALMVLLISVKNACKIGWFPMKESEELLTIANEREKLYRIPESINLGPTSSFHSAIPIIMDRFYPNMKLGPLLVSIEAKAGYGGYAVDFHITKCKYIPAKIWLLVAQTYNIDTSACLINPQEVNFLLNGKAIDRRTNVQMDPGPQMPTNVTSMLSFGTNLLQAVGHFNGHYIILVAYMNVTSLPEHPVIPNYVQPPVTSVDSDIIEVSSRISLNCPISFKRIKTPVKGHSCKHYQCFDFDNFVSINLKRPSWCCPLCNQSVCYTEIRLDQNMIEILENVGKDIVEVMINADGSWKAVSENDHDVEKEQTEPQESTCSLNIVPYVLDLTNEDDLDIMDTSETADRKPFQDSAHGQFSTSNSTSSGVPEHPVLHVTVSPASNHGAECHTNNLSSNSAMQNLISAPNNVQLPLNYINSVVNEYGRSSSAPRHINRIPIAVLALPVQPQASPAVPNTIPRKNSVTNLSSLQTSSSSVAPHVSLSNPAADILSDIERRQICIPSSLSLPQVLGVNSSTPTLQHQSETQNRVAPDNMLAPSQMQIPYIPQMYQTLNPQPYQPMPSSNTQWSHIQQTLSTAASLASRHYFQNQTSEADIFQWLTGDQRRPVQSVSRPDELFNSPPDPNWRPTARMRGSLAGQHLSDDIRQRIIAPSRLVQSMSSGPQLSSQAANLASIRNAQNSSRP